MSAGPYIAWFFGGAFLANAIPHLVAGVMGEPFQTPFAVPRGKGLSSSIVNVVWGFANPVFAWYLLARVGAFDLRDAADAGAAGLGVLLMALFLGWNFGKLHGGHRPGGS